MTRNMHHKITCRKQVLTPTSAGEHQVDFVDIATVWAEVTAKSGDLEIAARQSHRAASYVMRLRYQAELLASRSILWQGVVYRVVSLLNPDNRKRILELRVVEDHP